MFAYAAASSHSLYKRVNVMQDHVVHLLRIEGTADEECEQFLKCLYERIEPDSRGGTAPDQTVRPPPVAAPGDIQPVPITGDFGIEGAHVRVDELATGCRPDWETLYQLVR
jgi:hypothetical protein